MAYHNPAFDGGFTDPVFQAGGIFRILLDCLSNPGTIGQVQASAMPPAPMNRVAGAIALTLADHDTPVWLTSAMIEGGVPAWLAFHAGALVSEEKSDAAFAFVEGAHALPSFAAFNAGTDEYPDRSTTLILQVPALEGGRELELTGPGIRTEIRVAPKGLPEHFENLWAANRKLFPRGMDLILAADDAIMCLPRSTKIRKSGG
jgi:alpha-D-ribose 1-methylphosphonate 5-triphosphate synthase subunit PhnH